MCKWYLETLLAESSFITYIPPFSHSSTPPHITTPSPSFYIPWQSHPLIYCTASSLCLPVYPCMRLLNIYTVWCLSCECIELSPLSAYVTSDRMDKKTEACLFTRVCSGQYVFSHSHVLDSSKIQSHLKEEIGLKNISIYVISTLSICVCLSIWFTHDSFQPHQPFSSSICLVIHQSIYLIMLPNHPFTLPSVCQTISWYPFV